jgi:hypothetical protein
MCRHLDFESVDPNPIVLTREKKMIIIKIVINSCLMIDYRGEAEDHYVLNAPDSHVCKCARHRCGTH